MFSPALLHVLVVTNLLFSQHADFRILGRALLRGLGGALFSNRLEAFFLHLGSALLRILGSALLLHLFMANFAVHIAALLRVLHGTFEAGHVVAFFAFFCAANFIELQRTFLKRFLMANFPWCALAFLIELCGTLLGELFEALFLLLYTTFFPLRGVALLFVLSLAVGHLLHRAGGAVLGRALVLQLIGTNLFIGRSALRSHHILPL